MYPTNSHEVFGAPISKTRMRLAGLAATLLSSLLLLLAQGALAQLPVIFGSDREQELIQEEVDRILEQEVTVSVEEATEQNIQESVEDNIEEAIEQTVDASVEDTVQDTVAESIEDNVEESVASAVEDDVAASVEGSVQDQVEAGVETAVEAQVEDNVQVAVEESVEESVEKTVEASVEAAVEDDVAEAVEASVEESVAQSVEQDVDRSVEATLESSVERDVEQRAVAAIEERLENEIDEIVGSLESDLEVDEERILKEQWLVMAEPAVFAELTEKGYLFDTVTELPGLGLRLAEVAAPSTFDITQVRDGVLDVVGKDRAEVDLNHFYTAGVPEAASGEGILPRIAMPFPADVDDLELRLGMIDSRVDTAHPALSRSRIEARSFARPGTASPDFHGTAIASIIAGNSDDYQGLAPGARLFAASVFELDGDRGEVASTVSLIRALDWLISSEVDVVNVSLAGPPNRLLERALAKAAEQHVVVMAAAGNGGPLARPMYPAAYESVVAVTAVDSAQQVFRLANRGDYLALAAPGVDLRHARPGGGYASSSGTSCAVPFAATAAARLSHALPGADIITMLLESALDIGPPGRDQIYGYGLLTVSSL
jgi:subtilisin family serine protease